MKVEVRLYPVDHTLIQSPQHALYGPRTVRSPSDDFGNQRVIVGWDFVSAIEVGIDANARAARREEIRYLAALRSKVMLQDLQRLCGIRSRGRGMPHHSD